MHLQPLHEINHFKRKEKHKPVRQQTPRIQEPDVEVVDDDDFTGSLSLVRQNTSLI